MPSMSSKQNTKKRATLQKKMASAAAIAVAVGAAGAATLVCCASDASSHSSLVTFASALSKGELERSNNIVYGTGGHTEGMIDISLYKNLQSLTDTFCEGIVFPSVANTHTHRPYFIMLYSPTCAHCQELMPHFDNVAKDVMYNPFYRTTATGEKFTHNLDGTPLQPHQPNPHAPQFATINMVDNPRLRETFSAKSLPAFLYTIGGHAYPYQGAVSGEGFVRMAKVLTEAHKYNNPTQIEGNTKTKKADVPPLSIPIPDVSTMKRFGPFWERFSAQNPALNPMGSANPNTNEEAAVDGINVGITPPLFVVCQPPNSDEVYKITKDALPNMTSATYNAHAHVRRPAFSTFVESVMSTGRARFVTIRSDAKENEDDVVEEDDEEENDATANTKTGVAAPFGAKKAKTTQNVDEKTKARLLSTYQQDPENVFKTLRDTCASAFTPTGRKPSQGPNGEVLLLYSPDRSQKPIFYHGYTDGINNNAVIRKKWAGDGVTESYESTIDVMFSDDENTDDNEKNDEKKFVRKPTKIMINNAPNNNEEQKIRTRVEPVTSVIDAPTFRTSRALGMWVWENSYNTIEFGSNDVVSTLPKRLKLGVLVLDKPTGPVGADMAAIADALRTNAKDKGTSAGGNSKSKKEGNTAATKKNPKTQSFPLYNATNYYPGLNWLARKRFLAYRNKHKNTVETSVAVETLTENRRWPIPTPTGMPLISLAQTDYDAAGWSVRWNNVAPVQLLIVSAEQHRSWLERIGAGPAERDKDGKPMNSTKTTEDGASASNIHNVPPYFFAFDAINNQIAMMRDWLVDEQKDVLRGYDVELTATNAAALEAKKNDKSAPTFTNPNNRTITEWNNKRASDISFPQAHIPYRFEPKTGVALHLIDQFLNEFIADTASNNGRNDNTAEAATTTMKSKDDVKFEEVTLAVSHGNNNDDASSATDYNSNANADEKKEDVKKANPTEEKKQKDAPTPSKKGEEETKSKKSETTAQKTEKKKDVANDDTAAAVDSDLESVAADAANAASTNKNSNAPPSRLKIKHLTYSAAFVSRLVEVFPPADNLLRLCGDDHFLFVIMGLISIFVGLAGVLTFFGKREGEEDPKSPKANTANKKKATNNASATSGKTTKVSAAGVTSPNNIVTSPQGVSSTESPMD